MNNEQLLQEISNMLDKKLDEKLDEKLDKKLDEKLKPINDRMDKIDEHMDRIDDRMDKIEEHMDRIDDRMDKMEGRMDKLESQVLTLREGQFEIRKELREINTKVSETYQLALEAWGKSTENRLWLENGIETAQAT